MSNSNAKVDNSMVQEIITVAGSDQSLIDLRFQLATLSSISFSSAGEELRAAGQIFGPDRKNKTSPFGNGSDEIVAVSLLLRIGGELISSSSNLFKTGHSYSAAALLRQIVEVEYLAWAFETKDRDAERWLRSNKKERELFFKPSKLRKAAEGKFRGEDYGHHCELGGHPVPTGSVLLNNTPEYSQLLLSDLLGHTGRIWDHFVGWAKNQDFGNPILSRTPLMLEKFMLWKHLDPLVDLPPPP
jgi:hypothetical protein